MDDLLKRVWEAAQTSHLSHSINLTRLVDTVCTYTATCCGQTKDFEDRDDAVEWVDQVKREACEIRLLAAVKEHADQSIDLELTGKGPVGALGFVAWTNASLARQCTMQAREALSPEYSNFMMEVARRLHTQHADGPPGPPNVPFNPIRVA